MHGVGRFRSGAGGGPQTGGPPGGLKKTEPGTRVTDGTVATPVERYANQPSCSRYQPDKASCGTIGRPEKERYDKKQNGTSDLDSKRGRESESQPYISFEKGAGRPIGLKC